MKIVSYNIHFGGKTGPANQWHEVFAGIAPDIVFAQESLHPCEYFSADQFAGYNGCIWSAVPERKWGSAILAPGHELEPVNLDEFGGWVVGGKVSDLMIGGVKQTAMVFSVHAPSPGPYEPSVEKILDAIARRWDKTPLIVGGDFNLTTAIRHSSEPVPPSPNTAGERRILERMRREFGLFNAWQVMHPNENLPQTLRWNRDPVPTYHCDAIFLSHHFLPSLLHVSVESSSKWTTMSDHNPIVAVLA
jgi:endonuclease/exonuclease/phosphatase family metal-dependent hydrolase